MDGSLDDPMYRAHYAQAVASGEFFEVIYNCNECGHGSTALIHEDFINKLCNCTSCSSFDVTKTLLRM